MSSAPAPVVLLGEHHADFAHLQIEAETLRRAQALGYDTLAVEYPCDLEPAVHAYLASPRDAAAYRAFLETRLDLELAGLGEAAPEVSAADRREWLEGMRNNPASLLTKQLWDRAGELGYAVRCIDLPVAALNRLPEVETKADLSLRNRFMADYLAEITEDQGCRVILVAGSAHLLSEEECPSLQEELDRHEVPHRSFALAVDGRSPAREMRVPEERLAASVDRIAFGAPEIEAFLQAGRAEPPAAGPDPKERGREGRI